MKGIWYYICTLVASIVNSIAILSHFTLLGIHLNPDSLITLDRVMHAIIATRLVLSIRGACAHANDSLTGSRPWNYTSLEVVIKANEYRLTRNAPVLYQ